MYRFKTNKGEFIIMITKIRKFGAQWCGPCKKLTETLKSIDIPVLEIDVDENPELTEQYNIQSVPTLHFLDDNDNIVDTTIGNLSRKAILDIIERSRQNDTQKEN